MIQRLLFRILMAPFALLYGAGVSIRNLFYHFGILREISFNLPIISIGNLSVGGTGKTPHVEYLVEWLLQYIEVAILSRGYRRKTKGFLEVLPHSSADQSGDEPLQYKRKYLQAGVYVSESRVLGIPRIISLRPETQIIILDDAFQHRSVKPGINILMTEYRNLFTSDYLLPVGRLREWRNAYKRADLIIVSKCPSQLTPTEIEQVHQTIRPTERQQLFFSTYRYRRLYHLLYPEIKIDLQEEMIVLVLSAIADTQYLLEYLQSNVERVRTIEYEDHHDFSSYEIAQLKKQFDTMDESNKIIVTTEKDAVRLEKHRDFIASEKMPIFVLPIYVSFIEGEESFKKIISNYLLEFKS
jgi:tetraacyldisaccharide 4'-kinase